MAGSAPPTGTRHRRASTTSLLAMALCTDAVLGEGEVVGDPTEGALIVLAEKGGSTSPRCGASARGQRRSRSTPSYKFMATFHRWTDDSGRSVMRCFIKGAPDVLAMRADRYLGSDEILTFDEAARARYDGANAMLAEQGMRVLALGAQDFPAEDFDTSGDPKDLLDRIVLLALVGIVDPPRPEARTAIAQCREAGIRVRMITGDHAVTAGAIAGELGIPGEAVTGADLDLLADDDLADRLERHRGGRPSDPGAQDPNRAGAAGSRRRCGHDR